MHDAWSSMLASLCGSPVDAPTIRQLERFVVATRRHLTPEAFGDAGIGDIESAALWKRLAAELER